MSVTRLTIQKLGPHGDGIHEGRPGRIYVDRTAPGDTVSANVRRDSEGVYRADIVEILEPSRLRQPAPCPHYDLCGNCSLQHLKESFYRDWKIGVVRDALRKHGLSPREWLPPIFLGENNRRRATLSFIKSKGKVTAGYYRRRSKEIVDIDSCLVVDSTLFNLRKNLKPHLESILKEGDSADIFLQIAGDGVDMVMTGPRANPSALGKQLQKMAGQLLKTTPIIRVSWRAEESGTIRTIASRGQVRVNFDSLKVLLPPDAFLQPTLEGEAALVTAVMRALPERGKFADLFSGCGTFAGPMLQRGTVDAFESFPAAVMALSKSSGGRALRVFRRDLFRRPLSRSEINRYDAVVFDPPRAGCREQALAMASAKAGKLIGVSCNPITFARDARILCDGGYRLQSVQVVDQFLWSHHIELVGIFTKGNSGLPKKTPYRPNRRR